MNVRVAVQSCNEIWEFVFNTFFERVKIRIYSPANYMHGRVKFSCNVYMGKGNIRNGNMHNLK